MTFHNGKKLLMAMADISLKMDSGRGATSLHLSWVAIFAYKHNSTLHVYFLLQNLELNFLGNHQDQPLIHGSNYLYNYKNN